MIEPLAKNGKYVVRKAFNLALTLSVLIMLAPFIVVGAFIAVVMYLLPK